jgi:hypothetical protein
MDFLWMLTRVVVLVMAVIFTPDQVVLVWACGHFLAGLLYVLGKLFLHPVKVTDLLK